MELHPSLAELDIEYRRIVNDVREGVISIDDAQLILENSKVVDGEGALWSIDPHSGDFVRTVPGYEGSFADPQMFIGSVLPPIPFNGPAEYTGIPNNAPGGYAGPPSLAPIKPDTFLEKLKKNRQKPKPAKRGILTKLFALVRPRIRTLLVPGVLIVLVIALIVSGGGEGGGGSETTLVTLPVPVTISVPGVPVVPTLAPVDPSAPITAITLLPKQKSLKYIAATLSAGTFAKINTLADKDSTVIAQLLGPLGAKRGGYTLVLDACEAKDTNVTCILTASKTDADNIAWDLVLTAKGTAWVITKVTLKAA